MNQKTLLSPFNNFPADILGRLFGFFDRLTLIDITRVNKSWCAVAEPQLSEKLLQHHHTKAPDALKEGYLLNALCDWIESHQHDEGDIFSEEQQKSFLQQFKQAAWGIASDGSETPLQFIVRVSAIFQRGYNRTEIKEGQIVRSEYLQKYLKKASSQIGFLFHTENMQQFLRLYDRKTHIPLSITKYEDQKFLAQFLAYGQDLESFLTVLIFFEVTSGIPNGPGKLPQCWELLKRSYVKHMLQGDGIVALSTHYAPDVMTGLLGKWSNLNWQYHSLTVDETEFFLKKLCPADFIAYLNIGFGIGKAISNKQPQLIAMLSHGNVESDMALIHFCKKNPSEEFLKIVESIPELMLRTKDLSFLKRFLSALFISDDEKSWFIRDFLPYFTLPQLSLLCLHIEKGNLYQEDTYPNKRDAVKNQFTTKLFNEPNDQHLIDALFACSFIDSFKNHSNCTFFLDRLGRIQSKAMQNYLHEQAMKFCTNIKDSEKEKIVKKQIVVFFLVRSKIFLQFDAKQLVWLADPSCYLLVRASNPKVVCFLDFLEPLFTTGRITKDLFLTLTQVPHIGFLLRRLTREQREPFCTEKYSCVKDDLTLAFEMVNYVISYNKEAPKFLAAFKNIIQQFSIGQRIFLLENTSNRKNRKFLECVFSFEELRTLWKMKTSNVPDSLRETFFVWRLSKDTSAQEFSTEAIRCGIKNIKKWNQKYLFFSTRLQQPDVYLFVFGKCVSLLVTNDVKPLDQTILNWVELLAFLQKFSRIQDETQKHTILKQYTSRQLYTLCLQLRTKADDLTLESLQNLFYPLCLNLFDIADLHAFKETCSPNKLSNTLWPNHFINKAEEKLTEKIKQNPPSVYINGYWRYAITTRQFNIVLLLLLIGVGMFIPGLILNILVLWAVALLPIVVGIGILGIPILTTFISCLKVPNQQNTITLNDQTLLLDPDNAPTQTKREEITSQKIASSKPNPTPYKDVLQSSSTSIQIQSSDQEYLPRQVKSPTISNVSNSLDLVG